MVGSMQKRKSGSRSRVRHTKRLRIHRRRNPYARIDWHKASVLFQKPLQEHSSGHPYSFVKTMLHVLGAAGNAGLTLLFEAGKESVFESAQGEFSYKAWQMRQRLRQLEKQHCIDIVEEPDGKITVTITKHGMVRALTYELDTMKLTMPSKWDKKWRLVIFDIPEKERRLRDLFRMRLKQLGLYQLQESVYISPYPCFDEVEFLREIYGVAFTVRYLLVEKAEEDAFLRTHFKLW